MNRKQKEAKALAGNNKVRFVELMGYHASSITIPNTWKECIARFK